MKELETIKLFNDAFSEFSRALFALEVNLSNLIEQAETIGKGRTADKLAETQARLEESERQLSKVRGERNAAQRRLRTIQGHVANVLFRKAAKQVQRKSFKFLSDAINVE